MSDTLGDRIKRYESAGSQILTPRVPVMIRVDGRAFHTFTRDCQRPFDRDVIDTMVHAARVTAADMMGFRLGYIQSDEATFLLDDTATVSTEPWFGNKLAKIVSVSASLFTAAFNHRWPGEELATFDSRAFSIPREDAANAFVWRQRDWERNSLHMLARSHFSHRELAGKKRPDVHEMLHDAGVNWAKLEPQLKNGTFLFPGGDLRFVQGDYATITEWIAGEEASGT